MTLPHSVFLVCSSVDRPLHPLFISGHISDAGPDPFDVELNAQLNALMHSYNLFESEEESEKRRDVLSKLNVIVKEWIRQVCSKTGEDSGFDAGGKICAFGSYRLGVHNPVRHLKESDTVSCVELTFLHFFLLMIQGSDIDTLCVWPSGRGQKRAFLWTIEENAGEASRCRGINGTALTGFYCILCYPPLFMLLLFGFQQFKH